MVTISAVIGGLLFVSGVSRDSLLIWAVSSGMMLLLNYGRAGEEESIHAILMATLGRQQTM